MTNTLIHPWMIDPRTGTPLRALGVVAGRPVWPIMGAAEDDEEDDGEGAEDDGGDDEEDDGEGDDGGDPDAGKTPEELLAEVKALRSSRAKLLKEKANRSKGGNGKNGDRNGDGDGKDKTLTRADVDDLVEETKASERQSLMPAIVRTQSKSVLADLGMVFDKDTTKAKAQLSRVLKLADTDDLDLGDDGEVEGLEHALRAVKRDFPQLFRGSRVRSAGNAGGGGKSSTKPKSATEVQASHLFGGGDDD